MAVSHVIKLLHKIDEDEGLRNKLYECFDQFELIGFLNAEGYYFNNNDIENAVNQLHVQCQTIEAAQELLHKADWLKFLVSGK